MTNDREKPDSQVKRTVGFQLTLLDLNGAEIDSEIIDWKAFKTEQEMVKSCQRQRVPIIGQLGDYSDAPIMWLIVEPLKV